ALRLEHVLAGHPVDLLPGLGEPALQPADPRGLLPRDRVGLAVLLPEELVLGAEALELLGVPGLRLIGPPQLGERPVHDAEAVVERADPGEDLALPRAD